ncbi:hypothetical protein [Tsukamurella tyrosinosolvens]|uniref:hypothetical protein n=1 Tax=Tsukamurella tyrosinosolvens TaxID=57704 RepID=UPI002DD426D2|nr:hypothetical protein [Tsukamurella tyrosinosolvens]MEC4616307.1 hypothetical protein [Tsukamurella tyrosinosolvens]
MIRLHVTDDGVSVRLLGIEVAAVQDDRTAPEPRRAPNVDTITETITSAPRIARALYQGLKELRR